MATLQPVLVGSTIRLRPLERKDFIGLYEAANDPEIWSFHSEKNRYEKEVFKKFFDKALIPPGALVIEDLKSGNIIGSSRYYDWSQQLKQIVIGYTFLQKSYWGGLTNRELKLLMLNYAFAALDVKLVEFQASEDNLPSRRSLERLGAQARPGVRDIPGIGKRVEYFITLERWPEIHHRLKLPKSET